MDDDDFDFEDDYVPKPDPIAIYRRVLEFVLSEPVVSTTYVMRQLMIGYNTSERILSHLERDRIVGPMDERRRRRVLHRS